MWATLFGWILSGKWKLALVALAALAVLGVFRHQAGQIDRLKESNAAYALELDKVIAVNQGKDAIIHELAKARERDSEAITYKDGLINELNKELAAKRQEITQAAQSDPEYRDWSVLPVPALVGRVFSGGSAGGGADGAYPALSAPGTDGALPETHLERRD